MNDPFDPAIKAPDFRDYFRRGIEVIKDKTGEKQPLLQNMPSARQLAQPPDVVVPAGPAAPVMPAAAPVLEKVDIPRLDITGIFYGVPHPQAIINGKVISQGDTIDGVKILRIQKGSIEIRFKEDEYIVRFNDE